MKVGDLVRFRSGGWRGTGLHADTPDALGLIIDEIDRVPSPSRYKIWWMAQNKTGWWDSNRLKKIE